MQKKNTTSRLFNLTGYDNKYKATIQLLTEARKPHVAPGATAQDAIREAIEGAAISWGVTYAEIEARAAELDKADAEKAGQK